MQGHQATGNGAIRRGVTLIELMLVFVLVGIVASLAVPKINAPGFRADAEVRNTRTVLQMAQRLAVTRQYDVIVSFDTARQRIRIVEDMNNNGALDAGERVTWHSFEYGVHFATPPAFTGINGSAASAVTGTNVQTINGMPSIIFLRSGSASTDLQIYLTTPRSYTDDFRGITVTQSTGRTMFARFINSTWHTASI